MSSLLSRVGRFFQCPEDESSTMLLKKTSLSKPVKTQCGLNFYHPMGIINNSSIIIMNDQIDGLYLLLKNESCLKNTQKWYFLNNLHHFTPLIICWFRPQTAIQVAARWTISCITGESDGQQIELILQSNSGIYKYLQTFANIVQAVYSLEFLIKDIFDPILSKSIFAALFEYLIFKMNRITQRLTLLVDITSYCNIPSLGCLRENSKESERIVKGYSDPNRRDTIQELHLGNVAFDCLICSLRCPDNLTLLKHLREHKGNMNCINCSYITNSYFDLVSHKLTLFP